MGRDKNVLWPRQQLGQFMPALAVNFHIRDRLGVQFILLFEALSHQK